MGGCKSHGSVAITLELPGKLELNPMADPRLTSFSLILSDAEGNIQKINTVPYEFGKRELDIGDLPVGSIDQMTLVGYSDTNQVLAYAQASGIQVAAYDDVFVSLSLRRPYTYIAGGPSIKVFDTTRAHAADVVSDIALNQPTETANAVATTPDGRYVMAAVADSASPTASSLMVFNTGQHEEAAAYRVPLNHRPDFLSLSEDGHWAILSATDASRITVVDLEQVFDGVAPSQTSRDIVFAAPKRAAIVRGPDGRELAVVLQNSLLKDDICELEPLPSTLSVIELPDGNLLNSTFLDSPLGDVVARPGDSVVYAADTCHDRIITYDTVSFATGTLADNIAQPSSLLVKNDTLWIGRTDGDLAPPYESVRILIDTIDLNTGEYTPTVASPFFQEGLVVSVPGSLGTSRVVLRADPLLLKVYQLAIPPGGTRVSALVHAFYYDSFNPPLATDAHGDIDTVAYFSYSYVRLDINTGEIRRRFRAACFAFINDDLDTNVGCESLAQFEAPGSDAQAFIPEAAASLFGVP